MLQWTWECMYVHLSEILISVPLDKHPEVELLDPVVVVLFVIFWGVSVLFLLQQYRFTPTSSVRGSPFLRIFASVYLFFPLNVSNSVSWFWLAFPWWLVMFSMFSCTCWLFVCPLCLFLPIKNFFYLVSYFWLCWVFIVGCGLSVVLTSWGYSLMCSAGSLCSGSSRCGAWALGLKHVGSVSVVNGPSVLRHVESSWTRGRTDVPWLQGRLPATGPPGKSFCPLFKLNYFFVFLLGCMKSIYILDINPYQVHVCKYFPPFHRLSFHFCSARAF